MRWVLLTFLLTSLCFCGLRRAVEATDTHAEAFWRFVPGEQSRSLEHLEPVFKEKALQILRDLEREGYTVSIDATWRSPLRQEMLYIYSGLRSWVGLGEATQRKHQGSCHTRVSPNKDPAALALDIRLSEETSLKEHAAFFHRLGELARHHDLRWGGNWARRNATWRPFNLGWDPGHVESLRCR